MAVKVHFILYVRDQEASTRFYRQALEREPTLVAPGMTEFTLGDAVLGLMPESGAKRLLGAALDFPAPDATSTSRPARAELYLIVSEPAEFHRRALAAGARELSELLPRDWGHDAAYSADPDGHVLAFARVRPA